jgi:hypothetical protein
MGVTVCFSLRFSGDEHIPNDRPQLDLPAAHGGSASIDHTLDRCHAVNAARA